MSDDENDSDDKRVKKNKDIPKDSSDDEAKPTGFKGNTSPLKKGTFDFLDFTKIQFLTIANFRNGQS